jgi:hypothetical protein
MVRLLLHTDRPVVWQLSVSSASAPTSPTTPPRPPAIVTMGAESTVWYGHEELQTVDLDQPSSFTTAAEDRMKAVAMMALGHVATFATIESANKIVINLPQGKYCN